MKYDFTTVIDHVREDAIAIDVPNAAYAAPDGVNLKEGFDLIPMWIADMNFATVPTVQEFIAKRLKHPTFGYFKIRDEYFNKIIEWQAKQNGVEGLAKEHIGYENGVLGGVATALHVLCSQGDKILVHSPTYIGFTGVMKNNGYQIIHSPLEKDKNGVWRMNYKDMEEKIVKEQIHVAIFCSPHNPTGRVWERKEVEKAMKIFKKHNVMVISDEIWSDIILNGNKHVPTQSVSEDAKNRTIALYAPSKTFNLAGLIGSYHIVYNKTIRERMDKEASLGHYNTINLLSMYALMGAYEPEGYEWLEELKQVIAENADLACTYIEDKFDGVTVARPQGTYMLFLDCTEWCKEHNMTLDELLKAGQEVGVFWQDGRAFNGPCAIRMNLASPTSRIKEAFERLDKYVFNK